MKPRIIAIVGPTASGKTAVGIAIAKRFNGEIISVDSRAVYRGMDIGTAKPAGIRNESSGEMVVEGIVHLGFDLVEPNEIFSVADFKNYAENKIEEIISRGHNPILVGGTGLWLKALIENLDLASTQSDSLTRAKLESRQLDDLCEEFARLDPVGALKIDKSNKRRVVRALEVTKLSGKPWSQMQTKGDRKYDVLQIGIEVARGELYKRISARVDKMIVDGLIDEVKSLRDRYGCSGSSMTGIGYRQICEFLAGNARLEEAIEEIKHITRDYSKRQMTWFKRDENIKWVDNVESAFELANRFLSQY